MRGSAMYVYREVSKLNKNRILKKLSALFAAVVLCCALQCLPPQSVLKASAADGRLYNQFDPYWQTVTYNRYSNSGNSLYTSGCGIFSFCNAIYALNSDRISPAELGQWGVDNTGYRPGAGGLYRDIFYQNLERDWGERAHFHIEGRYYAGVQDSRLINHLAKGGVAVIHVSNHYMALSGYNPANGLYRVLESACCNGRGLAGESWVTAQKLSSGLTNVDWFALLSNTKKPGFSSVKTARTLYAVNETIDFVLDTDTRSTYGLGINNAAGSRVQTLYNTQVWAGCTRSVQASLPEVGNYSCYVTAHNGISGLDSSPIPITIYCGKPAQAQLAVASDTVAKGQPLTFRVTGGTAISYRLNAVSTNGQKWDSGYVACDLTGNTATYAWTPQAAGIYTCTVDLFNAYGSLRSAPVTVYVTGPMTIYLNANGGAIGNKSINCTCGRPFGALPVPVWDGYVFDGWYTQRTGGEHITAESIVGTGNATTLYAHWSEEVPETTAATVTTTVTTTTTTAATETTVTEQPDTPPLLAAPQAAGAGDLNSDGKCDAADAVLIYRIIAEDSSYQPTEEELLRADVNGDGIISMQDLQTIPLE